MAEATTIVTKEEVAVTKDVKKVILILTEDEAKTLAVILSRVGGSPDGTRGNADAITKALILAGYDWNDLENEPRFYFPTQSTLKHKEIFW